MLTSGIALVWPAHSVGWDPFDSTTWMLWALIVVTMFSLGTLVRPDELGPLRQRPWWVVLGVGTQVVVMPAAAWLVTQIVPMDEELAAGVILVGCVPGAMASNVLTSTAGGSVAYSVSLTTVATLLSPITVPLVLWVVTGLHADDSVTKPALLLTVFVVLPTVTGYLMARRSERLRSAARRYSSTAASIALLWIIATVVAGNRDRLVSVGAVLAGGLLVINAAGYAAGYAAGGLAGLPDRFRRALTLEVGMQNAGLGTVLAASLYGDTSVAMIPAAAYTFGCMFTGTLLAVAWRRRCQAGRPAV